MSDKTTHQPTKDLRDARLAKALQHAPDANAAPTPALRDTIKTIAASAISARATGQLPGKVSWWRKLWASTGSARGPWGGALATVVLGSIITAMWYGQEVPDEQVRYRSAAPEAAPAGVAAPAPMQERVPAPAPSAKSVDKQTLAAKKVATEQLRVQAPTRAQTNELATAPEEKRSAPAAPAAPPAMADKAQNQVATEAAPARREADAPSAPAVAGALSASGYAAAKAPSALLKSKAASAFDWHSATVQHQGRTTPLGAADASRLAAYVIAVVNTATPQTLTASPTTPTTLRIAFADAGGAQTVFTLWDGAVQWQRPGQADVVGVPQADALAQLLAQVSDLKK